MKRIGFCLILLSFFFVFLILAYADQNDDTLREIQSEGRVSLTGNVSFEKSAALTKAKTTAIEEVMETIVERNLILKNNEALENSIYNKDFEFIEDYNILKEGRRDGYYFVEIKANIRLPKLIGKLKDLNIFHERKIAVVISETIDGKENSKLSACENAIEDALVNMGYYVIHNKFIDNLNKSNNSFDDLVNKEKFDSFNLGSKINADILLIGTAQSSLLSTSPAHETKYANLYSARAIGNFKMFWVEDGEIIANTSDKSSAADVTADAANRKALLTLGNNVGKKIADKLLLLGAEDAKQ